MLANTKMHAFSTLLLAHLCEAALAANRMPDAQSWMSELESMGDRDHWCSSESLRVRGLFASAHGDHDAALVYLSDAVSFTRKRGALSWELRSLMSLAELNAGRDDNAEALGALVAASGRFKEGYGSSDFLKASRLIEELRAGSAEHLLRPIPLGYLGGNVRGTRD